jgi:hypothetical protein
MRISLTAFAGLLTLGSAALCEPPRAAPQPSQPDRRTTDIVLASAEVATPVQTAQPAPAKRRIVRVTTCRCGDPQPASESPEQ